MGNLGGLPSLWLVCGWFVGGLDGLWVVGMVCGWFGLFVGGFQFYS